MAQYPTQSSALIAHYSFRDALTAWPGRCSRGWQATRWPDTKRRCRMDDRYITARVQTYTSGTPGRALSSARANHFVIDDLASHGGPGEAINAAELFLSGITGCAVLMMERLARANNLPLKRTDVRMEGTIDTQAQREGPPVLDSARMQFTLVGLTNSQAKELVDTYKRR